MGLLEIGLRSLTAYQSALQVTAQNLTNVGTPFYSRKQVDFRETPSFGGVELRDVRRVYDEVANQNFLRTEFGMGRLELFYTQLIDFEKSLDTDATSVNKYLNDSLVALQGLTNNVSNDGSRASFLYQLQNVANRVHALGTEISKRKSDLRDDTNQTVSQMNSVIKQIASLNDQINQTPEEGRASLLDQRTGLVHELGRYLNFTARIDSNDGMVLSLSNGVDLVSGSSTNLFSTQPSEYDSARLKIMIGEGISIKEVTTAISDGRVKALLDLGDVLDMVDRGLGRLSLGITDSFNSQNKLGVDMRGSLGGNIFADMNTTSMSQNRVVAKSTNTGTGIAMSVDISNVNALTTSDYRLVMTSATNYSLTRLSDNTVVSSGALGTYPSTISADGFTTTITAGTFATGDTFTIKPTYYAMQNLNVTIADPQRLALAFPVTAAKDQANTGSGSIEVSSITSTSTSAFSSAGSKVLNPPLRIRFLSDTSYEILDMSNPGVPSVLEGPLSYDPEAGQALFPTTGGYDPGFRVNLKGTIKTGDIFDIQYNEGGVGNGNALAMSKLYSTAVLGNDGFTINQAYQAISNDISVRANAANTQLSAAKTLFEQAQDRYYQISGTSQQEEMENLMFFQQSYQASAQVIQAARSVFDTILSLMR